MKKFKILFILLAFLGLQACKTRAPRAVAPPVNAVRSVQSVTMPESGTTNTAGIGESLLTQGDAVTVKYIIVSNDQAIGSEIVRKGRYPGTEHTAEYDGFRVGLVKEESVKTIKPGTLYLFDRDKGSKNACLSRSVCGTIDFLVEQITEFKAASFQQTLLYSGKIGNRITLGYREFSNDSARPAFNNDVGYDLSESAVLGYKGARIEVIKATNTEITYRVVSGFH